MLPWVFLAELGDRRYKSLLRMAAGQRRRRLSRRRRCRIVVVVVGPAVPWWDELRGLPWWDEKCGEQWGELVVGDRTLFNTAEFSLLS